MVNIPAIRSDIIAAVEQMDRVICPTSHYHADGIYVREIMIPAGTVIIGHSHWTRHVCTLIQGILVFYKEEEPPQMVTGPMTFVAEPGHKIALAATDVIFQNVHPNPDNIRDLDQLEEIFVEKLKCVSFQKQEISRMPKTDHVVEEYLRLPHGFETAIAIRDSEIHGKGVFISCPFAAGEYIAPFRLGGVDTNISRFINHCDNPNCQVEQVSEEEHYLKASRPIYGTIGDSKGQELTIDYRELLT